jgi:phage-related protein
VITGLSVIGLQSRLVSLDEIVTLLATGGAGEKDLRSFPEPVQDHMGYALYVAQRGGKHRDTKTLSGLGEQVVEVVKDFCSDTFRTVYTTIRC